MKWIFYQRNDPRTFLYKFPRHKWMGVTLNFAHGRAWLILLWTLLPVGILLLPAPLLARAQAPIASYVGLFFVYVGVVLLYYFHMAAKEEALLRNCPEKIRRKVSWFESGFGLLCLAAYGFTVLCCHWYIVTGYDLASGRSWIRLAVALKCDDEACRLDPERGLTLYLRYSEPSPEYRHYRLHDDRYSPVYGFGNGISFFGKLEFAWDRFGWSEYAPVREKLRSQTLPAESARALHRRMIDLYHSGSDEAAREAGIAGMLDEARSGESAPADPRTAR